MVLLTGALINKQSELGASFGEPGEAEIRDVNKDRGCFDMSKRERGMEEGWKEREREEGSSPRRCQ